MFSLISFIYYKQFWHHHLMAKFEFSQLIFVLRYQKSCIQETMYLSMCTNVHHYQK